MRLNIHRKNLEQLVDTGRLSSSTACISVPDKSFGFKEFAQPSNAVQMDFDLARKVGFEHLINHGSDARRRCQRRPDRLDFIGAGEFA
ncbi:MAG: hypothetical protein EPN47_03345 [Acidobacteria bacterium]|nr:MAG: hypothetical protein EPN47_03345 [Acidobacteriota bacterium]